MALARGRHLRPRVAQRSTTRILPHNQRPARRLPAAGCRRLRVDYDRDSERFSAFAMLACEPRAVRGTATTPRGGPMDDRGAGRAAVRFGNADQERAEPGPGIAGAALQAAGGVVGRRSCRRDDVMVELTDGTRKLLSELTGAESAAGFRFRPDLQGLRIRKRPAGEPKLSSPRRLGAHLEAYTTERQPDNPGARLTTSANSARACRVARQLCIFSAPVTACP
jgi:hypothetical protein